MSKDLLFELGVEELPARYVTTIAGLLAANLTRLLKQHNLGFNSISQFATPRRAALVVHQLVTSQPDTAQEKLGPWQQQGYDQQGKPTKALLGFARSAGVSVDQLKLVEQNGKMRLSAHLHTSGSPTCELLPKLCVKLVKSLKLQETMRWGDGSRAFIRPVRWLSLVYGEQVIDCELFGIKASNTSYGHRFAAPARLRVTPAEYAKSLSKAFVIASASERKNIIAQEIASTASSLAGRSLAPASLLEELSGLVEYPRVLAGSIGADHMQLPREVLITTLEKHQRYIALESQDGKLMPNFLFVTNMPANAETDDQAIVKGNERVIKPRLEDAAFFWHRDCETTLEGYASRLDAVVFETRLGSMADKSKRLVKLIGELAEQCAHNTKVDKARLQQAASLCKADLVSGLVGELPELQGIIGGYLAQHAKMPKQICNAISQHYLPRSAEDNLPDTQEAKLLSLADKLDHLCSLFVVGKQGTAEADPFGARRACIGVLQLLLELPSVASLDKLLQLALGLLDANSPELRGKLSSFFEERLVNWYQRQSIPIPVVHAVLATKLDSITETDKRIRFLASERVSTERIAQLTKRIRNILGDFAQNREIDPKLFTHTTETALYQRYLAVKPKALSYLQAGEYSRYLTECNSLIEQLSELFDQVMIKSGDKKDQQNRFCLLNKIRDLCCKLADFTSL